MTKRLEGKRALVTGGSRGIGAAVAKRIAAEGAAVAITYNASPDAAAAVAEAIRNSGGQALTIQADAGDPAAAERAVTQAAEAFGGLDVAVLNAGVFDGASIETDTLEAFDRVQNVNVRGVFAAGRALAPVLSDGGALLLIGSVSSHWVPQPGFGTYSASKAAVQVLGKAWARDLGPRRIRVNVIQPGPIDTDMNPADGDLAKAFTPLVPLGRYGRPEEIAALAAFLASDEASYITGAAIDIDGGLTI